MLVAGKGLVTSGSVGYEIFDNQSVLGQTEFQQNLNEKRALEAFRKALAVNPHLEKVPEMVKTLTEKVEGRDI